MTRGNKKKDDLYVILEADLMDPVVDIMRLSTNSPSSKLETLS